VSGNRDGVAVKERKNIERGYRFAVGIGISEEIVPLKEVILLPAAPERRKSQQYCRKRKVERKKPGCEEPLGCFMNHTSHKSPEAPKEN